MRLVVPLHFLSPLFLLVPSGDRPGSSPRTLRVWDNQAGRVIKQLVFSASVMDCQWNKRFLAVSLQDCELHLFDLQTLVTRAVVTHFRGCVAFALTPRLSPSYPASDGRTPQQHYLIFATPDEKGSISVYDCHLKKLINKFIAHRTEIAMLMSDFEGKQVVTASKMGTIVRVFAVPSGDILYSFRIGAISSEVTGFQFCPKGQYLVVCTKHGHFSLCPLFPKAKLAVKPPTPTLPSDSIVAEAAMLENGIDLEISEEDGYCKIDTLLDDNAEGYEGGGFYSGSNPNYNFDEAEFDDNMSVLTDHTSATTTTMRAPAAADITAPSSSSANTTIFSGLLDQSTSMLSSIWNVANTQNVVDLTLAGVQKIKTYSQDIFVNPNNSEGATGDDANVHLELDQEIRRPILHLKCCRQGDDDDAVLSLIYDGACPRRQSLLVENEGAVLESLKAIIVTKRGIIRRLDLSAFQFHQAEPTHSGGLNYYESPSLAATTNRSLDDLTGCIEDERYLFS